MDSRATFHRGAPPQWLTPEGGVYLESTRFHRDSDARSPCGPEAGGALAFELRRPSITHTSFEQRAEQP